MSKYTLFIGTRRSGKTYRAIEEARESCSFGATNSG
jgi:hypothetical protein